METTQLLLIAAAVAAACGALFVAWAATSDSREARVYRRKWKALLSRGVRTSGDRADVDTVENRKKPTQRLTDFVFG